MEGRFGGEGLDLTTVDHKGAAGGVDVGGVPVGEVEEVLSFEVASERSSYMDAI
jgi:hypothetical protein